MNQLDLEVAWCSDCWTQHGSLRPCPGPIRTTGPERATRRFVAHLAGNQEHYQTLVAEAGELWRVRIVTIPRQLWAVPGGGGAAQFVDTTAAEAERKAVIFIYKRCKSLGVEVTELAPEQGNPNSTSAEQGRRKNRRRVTCLPAVFGVDRPEWPAGVSNLSPQGIYLSTSRPERPGRAVKILLQLDQFRVPLNGTVTWVKEGDGMGVELDNPPTVYKDFVATIGADDEKN